MVQIITDTTSCLPIDFANKYHIPVIPQVINFGNESFYEGVNLDNAGFMARLVKSNELPKTAAPPPELFSKEFLRLAPLNEPILCIHPSAEVSGTVRSAIIAAQEFPNVDIRVIDTRVVGSPLCTMVQLAAEWAAEGCDADTIESRLKHMSAHCQVYFLVATLEYLQRGGRIGGAQALLGSVLQIRPILCLNNGSVDRFESERTHKRALNRLKEIVVEKCPSDGGAYLSVMHAGVPEEAQELANELGKLVNQPNVLICDVPPAIVTHGGPGILAASFFTHAIV